MNACLVFAGVRKACRIEAMVENGHLVDALVRHGKMRGLKLIGRDLEPLLIDTTVANTRDIKIVERHYTIQAIPSQDSEPLVGAMGRLLGYMCKYPKAYSNKRSICLDVLVQVDFGNPEMVRLAGFACDLAMVEVKMNALREKMQRVWIVPANLALAGCEAKMWGKTFRIIGFFLNTKS